MSLRRKIERQRLRQAYGAKKVQEKYHSNQIYTFTKRFPTRGGCILRRVTLIERLFNKVRALFAKKA